MASVVTKPGQTDATAGGTKANAAGFATRPSDASASGVSGSAEALSGQETGKVSGKRAGQEPDKASGGGKNPRGRTARIWSVVWRGMVFLLLLLLFFLAGTLLALRNENVQAWIRDEINATLAASAAESGLHIRLTSFSGSLPFTATVGLELSDPQGLWLQAPLNTFVWDWAALPGQLRIAELTSREPRLLRLPDLPPSPPAAPTPPMTEQALRAILGQTVRTLNDLPGWLPEVQLGRLAVVNAQLPEFLLGGVAAAAAKSAGESTPASASEAADVANGKAAPKDATETVDEKNSKAAPALALPADNYFLVNFDASLKAGNAGGSLRAVLSASGLNNAPLPLPGAESGGIETRLEVNFAPRREGSPTPAMVALTLDSALEAKVLPAGSAEKSDHPDQPLGAPTQTNEAKAEAPASPMPTHTNGAKAETSAPAFARPANIEAADPALANASAPGKTSATKTPSGPLAALIADGARISLAFEAQVRTPEKSSAPDSPEGMATAARVGLNKFDIQAGPLSTAGHAFWQSLSGTAAAGAGQAAPAPQAAFPLTAGLASWFSGPLDVDLQINLASSKNTPAATGQSAALAESATALDMLAAPATVRLTAAGPLYAPDLNLRVECADLRMGAHKLEQVILNLGAAPLNWGEVLLVVEDHEKTFPSANKAASDTSVTPAAGSSSSDTQDAAPTPDKSVPANRPQLAAQLGISGRWDGQPLSVESQIFAGRDEANILEAGLRKLRLNALGLEAAGQLAASLPPGVMPVCDGKLDVRVTNWAALSTLVPGARLDGEATLSLELKAERVAVTTNKDGTASPAGQSGQNRQNTATPATQANLEAPSATTALPSATSATQANPEATPALPSAASAASALSAADAAASDTAGADPTHRYSQKADLRWNVPRLSYSAASGAPLTLLGLAGEVMLKDIFGAGTVTARLDLASVRQGDLNLGAKVRANGALTGPLDASIETSGSVAAHVNARWQPGLVQLQRLEARLSGRDLGFKATQGATLRYGDFGLDLKGLDIRLVPGGRLRAQAALGQDKLDVRLDLEAFALTPWKKFVPALPEGTVEARARLTGSPTRPGGDFRLGVRQLRIPGSPLKPLNLALAGRIEASGGSNGSLVARLEMDKESIQALGGSEALLEVRLPLIFGKDGLPQPNMQGPLRGQVRWKGAAGPLWSLLPLADQRFAGNVAAAVDLGGSLTAPSAKGSVLVDKGRYENLLQGVLLTNINLRLNLDEGRGGNSGKKQSGLPGIARLELDAAGGLGGKLQVAGFASLDGSKLDIKTTIDHLRPLSRRDIRIELSGEAGVTGSAAAPHVNGKIVVNQGLVQLNKLAVGGSVTTLPISETTAASQVPQAPTAEKPSTPGSLNLNIVIPGRFFVEGHGLTSEWKADILIAGTPEDPQITGQVTAVKGSFDFLTKIFKLSRGTITFAGGALSNPLLDIKLANETPNLTSYVTISGTVRKMKLSLSSEPELPRDEILAQILFGKSTNELGRLENLRLAGAVAQLAGFGSSEGGIFDMTRKALGVDVLRLNSGQGSGDQSGDEGMGAGTSVEVGKYITDIIYVGVQQGMKQGSTAFIIQLEVTPRTSLELRSEQQNTWGGIRWKYNY